MDSSWSDEMGTDSPSNWSNGVPTSTTSVYIGTQPSSNIIQIDTEEMTNTVASFTFNSTLTPNMSIAIEPFGSEQLTVNGAVTNDDNSTNIFELPFIAGANALYTGGTGTHAGLEFTNTFTVGLNQITTSGNVDITQDLVFTLNSISNYGTIGPVDVSGATINIYGNYLGVAGNNFFLTSGNFSGATLGHLPTLSTGLYWVTTNFTSEGELSVAPEPPGLNLLLGGLGLLAVWMVRSRWRQFRLALASR